MIAPMAIVMRDGEATSTAVPIADPIPLTNTSRSLLIVASTRAPTMRPSINPAQYAARIHVAARGGAPTEPTYVDVHPPIADSFPDSQKSRNAKSITAGYFAARSEAKIEKPALSPGRGNGRITYATVQMTATDAAIIRSCEIDRRSVIDAASSGRNSAPKPKKTPSRLSIA